MSKTTPTTQPSPTRHTPGPLTVSGNRLYSDTCKDRGSVAECRLATGTHIPDDQNEANAARLALCWNTHDDLLACAKSNVLDMLEILTGVNGLDGESAEIARLKSLIEGRIAATKSTIAAATGGVA